MAIIEIQKGKRLKLSNVIIRAIDENELVEVSPIIENMKNYIILQKVQPTGPLIYHNRVIVTESGNPQLVYEIMMQCSEKMQDVAAPYYFQELVHVSHCIYTRFQDEQNHIKYAYDKMNVLAYEENLKMTSDVYTIILEDEADRFTADIFMEEEA